MNLFTQDEELIKEAIISAREVQEYIWADLSLEKLKYNPKTWAGVFAKRVLKIEELDNSNPSNRAELRKRILQQAALSICALKVLDKEQKENTKVCGACQCQIIIDLKSYHLWQFKPDGKTKIYFCENCCNKNEHMNPEYFK